MRDLLESAAAVKWAKEIAGWQRSGEAATEFCRRRGLSRSTFGWWRWRLGMRSERRAGFVAVRAKIDEQAPTRSGAFELGSPRGYLVRVPMDFDADALGRLLGVIEGR